MSMPPIQSNPNDPKTFSPVDDQLLKKEEEKINKQMQQIASSAFSGLPNMQPSSASMQAVLMDQIPLNQPLLSQRLLSQAIQVSKLDRLKMIDDLAEEEKKQIFLLQHELEEQIKPLALNYAKSREVLAKIENELIPLQEIEDPTKSQKAEIERLESEEERITLESKAITDKIKGKINKIITENKNFQLNLDIFSPCYHLYKIPNDQDKELAFEAFNEQLLNRHVNSQTYRLRLEKEMGRLKEQIIREFLPHSSAKLDLGKVDFKIEPTPGETHNKGTITTIISFYLGDKELLKVVYKPRDAEIDREIIALFDEINHLKNEEKSLLVDLPVYKLIPFNTLLGKGSLWEYIEGKHLGIEMENRKKSAQQVISEQPEAQRIILLNKLTRLESICSKLNISDLHLENIIFQNLNSQNNIFVPNLVPIDLESIQMGNSTGLCHTFLQTPALTQQEKALLDKFYARIPTLTFRSIPLATSILTSGLINPMSFEKISMELFNTLSGQNCQLTCNQTDMYQMVLKDLLNYDIPYLIQRENTVYYLSQGIEKPVALKV